LYNLDCKDVATRQIPDIYKPKPYLNANPNANPNPTNPTSILEFGRFGSNRRCPMFRYSGEKIPMSDSDSDVYLFGHAKLRRRGGRRSATANDR